MTALPCEIDEEHGVATGCVPVSSCTELLPRVLPDRLQHPVALVREAEEALLDEGLQGVEVGVCDLFRCLKRAAAGEDGEGAEEALLFV